LSPTGARLFAKEIGWGLKQIPGLTDHVTLQTPPLPEPAGLLLLAAGPFLLCGRRRRG
jgi:hypothetical protein